MQITKSRGKGAPKKKRTAAGELDSLFLHGKVCWGEGKMLIMIVCCRIEEVWQEEEIVDGWMGGLRAFGAVLLHWVRGAYGWILDRGVFGSLGELSCWLACEKEKNCGMQVSVLLLYMYGRESLLQDMAACVAFDVKYRFRVNE